MAYDSGTIKFTLQSNNLKPTVEQAQSINKNMTEAALATSRMGKAASGALKSTTKGTFGESVAYGQARGTTGQTGASARDFSNQAQGLGGLVRLYATFAANIFAVGMAFEALKRSFSFEQLQRASEAFAITTGKNLAGVASELQKLSQGTLTDKAAQQMANYGSSAGFTSEQMKRLVGVARGASQALGRDMGDAIDRLMRGTGKLEPELLDELGLLTRTKAAASEYGKTLGKTFEQMTQFEKTQGFINAVLKEGEEKFGAVSKAVDASPFERFTASLLSMGTSVGNVVNKVLVPILDFFSNNPTAMIVAMAAAFGKLLMTALPALSQLGQGARASAEAQKLALEDLQKRTKEAVGEMVHSQVAGLMKVRQQALDDVEAQKGLMKENVAAQKKFSSEIVANAKSEVAAVKAIKAASYSKGVSASTLDKVASDPEVSPENQARWKELAKNRRDAADASAFATQKSKEAAKAAEDALKTAEKQIPAQNLLNKIHEDRLKLSLNRANTLASVEDIARVGSYSGALDRLKQGMKDYRAEYEKIHGVQTGFGKGIENARVGLMGLSGGFRIATVAASTFLSTVGIWLGVITLIGAALYGIASAAGAFNKEVSNLEKSQETYGKALDVLGKQLSNLNKLQLASANSSNDFLKSIEYSSNVFNTLTEGLHEIAESYKKFTVETGKASAAYQWFLNLFGWGVKATQVEQLTTTIYGLLNSLSGSKSEEFKSKILNLIPDAKNIDDVKRALNDMSEAQRSMTGLALFEEAQKQNMELKNQAATLKTAEEAWKGVEKAAKAYLKKEEIKDPKLKNLHESLAAVEAITSAEARQATLAKFANTETLENLQKIWKARGLNVSIMEDLIVQINEAKKAEDALAKTQKDAAIAKKESDIAAAGEFLKKKTPTEIFIDLEAYKNIPNALVPAMLAYQEVGLKAEESAAVQKLAMEQVATKRQQLERRMKDAPDEKTRSGIQLVIDELLKNDKVFQEIARQIGLNIGAQIKIGVSQGVAGVGAVIPEVMEGVSGSAAEHAAAGRAKEAKDALNRANAAIAASDKERKNKEKIAKFYEYEIQAAVMLESKLRSRSELEKKALGFIQEQTAEEMAQAAIVVAGLTRAKRYKELELELNKEGGKNNKEALENLKKGTDAANATYNQVVEKVKLEKEETNLLREKVVYEKTIYDVKRQQIDIANQILDIQNSLADISEREFTDAKALLATQQAGMDIAKQRDSFNTRYANMLPKLVGPALDVYNAEKSTLEAKEKQIVITENLTKELSKIKQYWDQIAIVNETIATNMGIQLKYSTTFVTNTVNVLRSKQIEKNIAKEVTKTYVDRAKAAGIELDSLEGQLMQQTAILEITDKIYDQRVRMYELDAKENSGADFLKTIGTGFEIEAEKFKKSIKSTVQTVVDGTLAALDAPIDYIVNTLKGNGLGALSGKELAESVVNSLKASLYDYVGNSIKVWTKDFLAQIFGSGEAKLESIQEKANKIHKEAIDAYKEQKKPTLELIDQLKQLNGQIAEYLRKSGGNSQSTIPNLANGYIGGSANGSWDILAERALTQTVEYSQEANRTIVNVTTQGLTVWERIEDYVIGTFDTIAKLATGVYNGLGSLFPQLSTGTAAVGSMFSTLGSFGLGDISKWNPFGQGFSLIDNKWGGGAAGNTGGAMASQALGGAGIGYGVGTLSHALFGNERNQTGMTAGGTLGGAIGGMSGFGPLGSIIGSIIGSAIGSLIKEGGGPKLESYASTDNTLGGNEAKARSQSRTRTEENNGETQRIVDATLVTYNEALRRFGGTGVGAFAMETSVDTEGTASPHLGTRAYVNGKEVYNRYHGDNDLSRDPETLAAQIKLETSRAVFAAVRASNLPENVAAYFNQVTEEGIKSLTEEDISKKFDFGQVLGVIAQSRELVEKTFGEDLFNITEEGLKKFSQGTETFSETFGRLTKEFDATNAAIDLVRVSVSQAFGDIGLASTAARENFIDLAGGLESFNAKVAFFAENFFTDNYRSSVAMSSAQNTLTTGFAALNTAIPTTREGFTSLYTAALAAGDVALAAKLLDLAPAMDLVLDAAELLTENTNKLNESLGQFNLTFGEDFVSALDVAGIAVDDFIKDVEGLAGSMLTDTQQESYAVTGANSRIGSGYLTSTGAASVPKSREELWSQFVAEDDPVKKAAIASWWKDFDIIWDAADRISEKAKKLDEDLKSVDEALAEAGLTLSEDFLKALLEVDGATEEMLSQLSFYTAEFLSDTKRDSLAVANAISTIGAAGIKNIPDTREAFVKLFDSASDTEKVLLLKLAPAFDVIYDSAEAVTKAAEEAAEALEERLAEAISTIYTDTEQASLALADANTKIGETFAETEGLANKSIPQSRAAFVALFNSSDYATQQILFDLVPAFGVLFGSMDDLAQAAADVAEDIANAVARIESATKSFADEIEDELLSEGERYNKYQKRSHEASDTIDKYMKMGPEDLLAAVEAGTITSAKVADEAEKAVSDAKTAWGNLTAEQKKVMGPAFITYIEQLEENAKQLVARVGAAETTISQEIAKAPDTMVPKASPTDSTSRNRTEGHSSTSALSTTSSRGAPVGSDDVNASDTTDPAERISKALSTGGTAAGVAISAAMIQSLTIIKGVFGEIATSGESQFNKLQSSMQKNTEKQSETLDLQQKSISDTAKVLLDAANKMLDAAAGQQQAADTPKKIDVEVDLTGLQTAQSSELGGHRR